MIIVTLLTQDRIDQEKTGFCLFIGHSPVLQKNNPEPVNAHSFIYPF